MEEHKIEDMFECNLCDKKFVLKWRLTKHIQGHERKQKFCHFYKNWKDCPYEKHGCMFVHEPSPSCIFQENCLNTLCQYRHCDEIQDSITETDCFNDNIEEGYECFETKLKCNACSNDISTENTKFKCEECEENFCKNCPKKSLTEDTDRFMCYTCQC